MQPARQLPDTRALRIIRLRPVRPLPGLQANNKILPANTAFQAGRTVHADLRSRLETLGSKTIAKRKTNCGV